MIFKNCEILIKHHKEVGKIKQWLSSSEND